MQNLQKNSLISRQSIPSWLRFGMAFIILVIVAACSDDSHTAQLTAAGTSINRDATARLTKAEIVESFNHLPAQTGELVKSSPDRPVVPLRELVGSAKPLNMTQSQQLISTDIDLSNYDSPVKQQGSRGWCTAFATVAAMENFAKQSGDRTLLSEIHLWSTYQSYNAAEALQAAHRTYVVPATIWPYNRAAPRADLNQNGVAKVRGYRPITAGPDAIAKALRSYHPVVFAVQLSTTFQSDLRRGGLLRAGGAPTGGGHAVELVGVTYSPRVAGGGYFTLKNSWGPFSGDHGYAYMPFSYCSQSVYCYAWELMGIARIDGR